MGYLKYKSNFIKFLKKIFYKSIYFVLTIQIMRVKIN